MGDNIQTSRSTGSDYWADLSTWIEQKSKQTAIDNRPELLSSPINNPAQIIYLS